MSSSFTHNELMGRSQLMNPNLPEYVQHNRVEWDNKAVEFAE
jgi:hypothetical protein